MRSWIAVTLFLVACRGGGKATPTQTGSAVGSAGPVAAGSGSAADPWQQPETKPATPEEKRKRAEAAIGRVTTVQPKLAALRGLPLDKPVVAELQSTDEFRKFVQREIEKE